MQSGVGTIVDDDEVLRGHRLPVVVFVEALGGDQDRRGVAVGFDHPATIVFADISLAAVNVEGRSLLFGAGGESGDRGAFAVGDREIEVGGFFDSRFLGEGTDPFDGSVQGGGQALAGVAIGDRL